MTEPESSSIGSTSEATSEETPLPIHEESPILLRRTEGGFGMPIEVHDNTWSKLFEEMNYVATSQEDFGYEADDEQDTAEQKGNKLP